MTMRVITELAPQSAAGRSTVPPTLSSRAPSTRSNLGVPDHRGRGHQLLEQGHRGLTRDGVGVEGGSG